VPQAAAPKLARRLARAIAFLLDLAANMAIRRRGLLYLAIASATLAATDDTPRSERSLGSARARQTATEYFSLSCPHCAEFALKALPEIRTRFIAPGRLRWVFFDFPTDKAALQAAMVARYLP